MQPFKLKPAVKNYLWGGKKLGTDFNKHSEEETIAESWELSCNPDGESTIVGGDFDGFTLSEFIKRNGKALLGKNCAKYDIFPILIKFIDAKENLSIQVHPTDEYMKNHGGGYGKTELWHILDCEPGALIISGLKSGVTKDEFAEAIENNTLLDCVNYVPVKKGDTVFIEAGTIHAIGKGILLAEIQQNSNTTFRVYDYGRTGSDGQPRPLHIKEALEVINSNVSEKSLTTSLTGSDRNVGNAEEFLGACEYFSALRLNIKAENFFAGSDTFLSLLIIDGEGELTYLDLKMPLYKGDSIFIPAGCGKFSINGDLSLILTSVE
ncbi:MAG: class I mannose-6-phosphate isomerase [Ruminococcus sp.]|jgi:mannose-6-phosphate isomerase|nr:class I mannose-6-phosphate isomerase [Ruminococcus sp.]